MAIVTEIENSEALEKMLSNLSATNLHRAVARASGRAATAARTAGTKQLRSVYTMKTGDMKSRVSVRKESDGTTLLIRGSVEHIEKFRTRVKRGRGGGVFASVKRGTSSKVPRSFEAHGHMFKRDGKGRIPYRGLYGPAVPQMFGNPEVLDAMDARGSEVFETRLYHEISQLTEG